jgi:hypothetical protein
MQQPYYPGNLANSWAESTRLHRGFTELVRECWQACQRVSDQVPEDAPEVGLYKLTNSVDESS